MAQTQDEYCQILLDKLVDDQCRVNLRRGGEDYFYREKLHDGTIGPIRRRYFSEEESRHHKTSVKREMKHKQIVVPKQLVRQCIRFHHEGLAHPGRAKTTQVIQMSYYWPTIRRDCSNYLHQCHYCAARKAHNLRARVPIMQYDRPVRPFYRMHMDLTGRLNTTVGGMEYILVFKCALTKWVEIFALSDKSALEVARCLMDEVIWRHGCPYEIITDRGNEFFNSHMKSIVDLLAIPRHIKTTAYTPSSDGMVERQMRTLKDQLVAFTDKYQRNWDEYLGLIAGMYRMQVNSATGYSPFYLIYGREPELPHDTHLKEVATKSNLVQYVKNMVDVMQDIWSGTSTTVVRNTLEFNKAQREPLQFKPYEVGDYFMMRCYPKRFYYDDQTGQQARLVAKLLYRWSGPYRVTEKISPVLYEAFVHGKMTRVHAINMKPKTENWSNKWRREDEDGVTWEHEWIQTLRQILARQRDDPEEDDEFED